MRPACWIPHSPVAQSVEQVAVNHPVGGSSPSGGAMTGSVMEPVFCIYVLR